MPIPIKLYLFRSRLGSKNLFHFSSDKIETTHEEMALEYTQYNNALTGIDYAFPDLAVSKRVLPSVTLG